MLKIIIPAIEQYDELNNEFIISKEQELCLEHSLISVSKWESKWKKPFLSRDKKNLEETNDYIKQMVITDNISESVYLLLTKNNIDAINAYISDNMTATKINDQKKGPSGEIITSEIIYHWMISYNIPFECQKWHLNRLLTLINVCNIKSNPPKKMSKRDLMSRNAAINAARKKSLNTGG